MSKELKQLLGIHEPTFYKCLIAVTFDGSDLEDNLTENKNLPKEAGIYKCVIRYHSFKCNIPIDPEEWDCNVTIESCELVGVSF